MELDIRQNNELIMDINSDKERVTQRIRYISRLFEYRLGFMDICLGSGVTVTRND